MNMLLTMLPTIVLVVFSQLATKWRVQLIQSGAEAGAPQGLLAYLSDPWIWAAYAAAFLGAVCWMFVVRRYAISVAFPVYIGLTVLCVVLGGVLLFAEPIRPVQGIAILLVVAGVALAVGG